MSADARRLGLVAALLLLALLGAYARPYRAVETALSGTATAVPASAPSVPQTGAPRGPDPAYVLLADSDWWTRTTDETLLASPYDLRPRGDLASLPRQLGEWRGVDEPDGDTESLTLGAKQHVLRRYTNERGEMLWLRLLASADWNMFYHNPPTCYRANGWQLEPESRYAVPVGDATLRLRGFAASQPTGKHLVLFGFLWSNQYRDMADGTTLLEIVVPLAGDRDQAARLAVGFAGLLFSGSPNLASVDAGRAQHQLAASLDGQVTLLGYDLDRQSVRPGEALRVTLYWQANRNPAADYTVFVQLLGPEGAAADQRLLAQLDRQPYAGLYPTSRWRVGQILKETYELKIPPSTADGQYELIAGMYSLPDGRRLGESIHLEMVPVAKQ